MNLTESNSRFYRVLQVRKFGKIIFVKTLHYNQQEHKQLIFKASDSADFDSAKKLVSGNIISIDSYSEYRTDSGEDSFLVIEWHMLSSNFVPLPDKWNGISPENFRNQRTLSNMVSIEARKLIIGRHLILKALRSFLDAEGYIEVTTPIICNQASGADAEPFKTYRNSDNKDLFFRIAPELNLKRLVVSGFDKIYEIGPCFRNEGIDKTHFPEFYTIEVYTAIDLPDLEAYNYLISFVRNILEGLIDSFSTREHMLVTLTDFPIGINPLAKASNDKLLKFELELDGVEIADGFVEQNNPIKQREAFEQQGFVDESYIADLDKGLLQTVGFAIGIDRLVSILFQSEPDIKNVIPYMD